MGESPLADRAATSPNLDGGTPRLRQGLPGRHNGWSSALGARTTSTRLEEMRRPRQGLGSTRGTAAVHRRSDIALRGPALACAALVFFLPVVAPLASPQLLSAIYDGQKLEERHQGKLQVLDSVVVPATDCSISRPCWPIVTGAEQVHPMIESRHSLKLLYRLTPGMRGVTNIGGTSRQLLKTSLIDVLFAIDPQTFFFFYISGERLERANPNMPRESAWPRRGARSGPCCGG